MSNIIARNEPGQQPEPAVPPGLQAPDAAEPPPSRIALKRRPAGFRAANAVATIGMIRHDVEEGSIDAAVMLDMAEVVAELQYALATELKARLTRGT